MTGWWDKQIQRADQLAEQSNGSRELLLFYAHLLRAQQEIYEFLRGRKDWLPSGELELDLPIVRAALPGLLRTVASQGPASLAAEAHDLSESESKVVDERLMSYWHSPTDTQIFGKACLQPYLRWLADTGARPSGREFPVGERYCPFCGGNTKVSFLQIRETTSESGNRDLVCATCTNNWSFRRVACAYCGEERPTKLGYFHTPEYDHIRIEACDTCKRYIKGVDLTKLGFAIPLVDEVAAAALDVWAPEHGYKKIELNLVGL